ncbi:hypothetical protein [Sphingomonas melonis]|uniref:Magnesium-transporting ATPase (P-type) n=1 Tax=Sphingomonas melonis TaxID=152682 RepID=A0A7Y9FNX9_9SPHN|nr:hypothetical protein [Sphingomonas melonis]NYD90704.1 magnesium-transporting ATPase (P-type) [Sphingomonas melonis]
MVKMGNVWDRSAEVLNGRGGMLAGIAALSLYVPQLVNAAWTTFAPPSSMTTAMIGLVIVVSAAVVAIWGQLALIAASLDPATDRRAAIAQANSRLAAALLVAVVLTIVITIAFLPSIVLLIRAGFDYQALAAGTPMAPTNPGAAGLAGLYAFMLGLVLLFVGARMLPLYAVVLHERLGVAAIARCWRLTRRHTWRLVGAVLLFVVVLMIATWAAQMVSGLIFRLALGADAQKTVAFLAAAVGQAVSTALTLVAIVFSAQLYVALLARERLLREKATRGEVQA